MEMQGISHIGIGVKDLARSVEFYRDVLGLPIVHEMNYDEIPQILRYPDDPRRQAAYFRVGTGDRSVIIVMGTIHDDDRNHALLLDELGLHHFAFWVDDITALRSRLENAGADILTLPMYAEVYHVDHGRNSGPCTTMFFRDPDGIMLQADQRV